MDPKDSKLRLTADSQAVRLLREKFESGAIDPAHTASRVRNSEYIFQRYPLTNFRTCYNKLKREYYPGKY